MRDINLPMRKAYKALLTTAGLTAYYQQAPDDITDDVYVVFDSVSNSDGSTMNSADLRCSMRVTVHTWTPTYNTGTAADVTAGIILQALYPTPANTLQAEGVQVLSTRLASDQTLPYNMNNTRNYIDRILIFEHKVFLNN